MVSPIKTVPFWSAACSTRRRFKVFRSSWEKLLGVSLPFPSLSGAESSCRLSLFKEFCSGLLEHRTHLWDEPLRRSRVSLDMRWSLAHSLFLFRKVLSTPAPSVPDFIRRVSLDDGEADPLFMEFIRKEVPVIFRNGWDSQYPQRCLSSTVPVKSCSENSREYGGSRGMILSRSLGWEEARADFIESVLASQESSLLGKRSRVVAVSTSGKWRVLTVPPVDMNRLRPLHECMYNHLSRFKWLLRGDAKPSSFKDFSMREGEVFVSGDYESATDNLNSSVQKEILRLVLQGTRHVPKGIIADAMMSFSLDLTYRSAGDPPVDGKQRRGQMMGNLLSFPLLCLVNYLTFRWLTMDLSIPVKVNGDDIVFRSTPKVANRWMEGVGASGLVLSRGKTLLDRRYFTLNSLLFKAKGNGVAAIPIIRSRTLFGMEDSESPIGGLAGRFSSFCPGFFGSKRRTLRGVFLRENSGWINQSRRSLLRGLGVPVTAADLKSCGLWARELEYLALPSERAVPPTFSCWSQVPEGFEIGWREKGSKGSARREDGLAQALLEAAWKPARRVGMKQYNEAWFTACDLGAWRYTNTSKRFDRLAMLTRSSHAWVRSRMAKSSLQWAFQCCESFDSWSQLKETGKVSLDALFKKRLDQRIPLQSYYRPVSRQVLFRSDSGSYVVNATSKLAASCSLEEADDNNPIDWSRGIRFPPPLVY